MGDEKHIKGQCQKCLGIFEFPAHGLGQAIVCPHCGLATILKQYVPIIEMPDLEHSSPEIAPKDKAPSERASPSLPTYTLWLPAHWVVGALLAGAFFYFIYPIIGLMYATENPSGVTDCWPDILKFVATYLIIIGVCYLIRRIRHLPKEGSDGNPFSFTVQSVLRQRGYLLAMCSAALLVLTFHWMNYHQGVKAVEEYFAQMEAHKREVNSSIAEMKSDDYKENLASEAVSHTLQGDEEGMNNEVNRELAKVKSLQSESEDISTQIASLQRDYQGLLRFLDLTKYSMIICGALLLCSLVKGFGFTKAFSRCF